jgi:hypothetical protein
MLRWLRPNQMMQLRDAVGLDLLLPHDFCASILTSTRCGPAFALTILRSRTNPFPIPQRPLTPLTPIANAKLLILGSIFLNPLTVPKSHLQIIIRERPSAMVMRTQQRNDSLTRLTTIVMRNRREKMMRDVITRNGVEEMRTDDAKVSVDSRRRTAQKSLALARVLGHILVCVVQVGDHDNEVVDHAPRDDIDPEDQFKAV